VWIEAGFILASDPLDVTVPLYEVGLDFGRPPEVEANDLVNVGKVKGGVLLRNLLGGGPLGERHDHRLQGDPGLTDACHPVGVDYQGNRFCG
jgi:hypothetical protein